MHDLNAVFNPRIHVIQGDNILGLMILDLHEVAHLVVRVRRQLDADLHIDPLIAAGGHKVDLLGIILADIHIVPPPLKLQKHDVLHGPVQHFAVIAQQGIFQGDIGQIILLQQFLLGQSAADFEVQLLAERPGVDGDRHIASRQIGGDLVGHELGVGAGHIDVGVRTLQQSAAAIPLQPSADEAQAR